MLKQKLSLVVHRLNDGVIFLFFYLMSCVKCNSSTCFCLSQVNVNWSESCQDNYQKFIVAAYFSL